MGIRPGFERLAQLNMQAPSVSSSLERLANPVGLVNLSHRTDELINKNQYTVVNPVTPVIISAPPAFSTIALASRRNIALNLITPEYRLPFTSPEIVSIEAYDVVQFIQQDMLRVNPEAPLIRPATGYEVAPQNVSLHSILAAEAKK
jgi:hypothetical protein